MSRHLHIAQKWNVPFRTLKRFDRGNSTHNSSNTVGLICTRNKANARGESRENHGRTRYLILQGLQDHNVSSFVVSREVAYLCQRTPTDDEVRHHATLHAVILEDVREEELYVAVMVF